MYRPLQLLSSSPEEPYLPEAAPTGSLPTVAVSRFTPQSSSDPPESCETLPSGFVSSHSPQFALTYICMCILCHLQGKIPFTSQLSTHTDSSGKDQCLRGKHLFLLCSGHPDISHFVYFFFLIVKYTQHKICRFMHFEVHSLVALSTFALLDSHHPQPSPELCHYPKRKLCFH